MTKARTVLISLILTTVSVFSANINSQATEASVLRSDSFKHFVDEFNNEDDELYKGSISNSGAWDFLKDNIPLFDSPDADINETYYFRWWTYRKHVKETPEGCIVTEFLPDVPWAGKDNSISCAAGHHFYEGRWLAEQKCLDDYAFFWFRKGGEPRRYSFWAADALWAQYEVTGDDRVVKELLPDLIANYEAWEKSNRDENGLFWQGDDRDGMEMSIGGGGYRPSINSYMYGEAMSIAKFARLKGKDEIAKTFLAKAAQIKDAVQSKLWDLKTQFFKTLPREREARLVDIREEIGYTPWYFDLPDADKSAAWSQLMNSDGFFAPFGPTTAERRSPEFRISYEGHECQWNGPSWPYATSITLTAMANLLDHYKQTVVTKDDYFTLLKIYAKSQHRMLANGRTIPWIDENLNPTNGDWIARTVLKKRGSEIVERGKDYNHSTFCDLVITGLAGLRPRADNVIEVDPLAAKRWDYFCLDRVRYHGHWLTILWDKSGQHYGKGKGLHLLVDGVEKGEAPSLEKIAVSGW